MSAMLFKSCQLICVGEILKMGVLNKWSSIIANVTVKPSICSSHFYHTYINHMNVFRWEHFVLCRFVISKSDCFPNYYCFINIVSCFLKGILCILWVIFYIREFHQLFQYYGFINIWKLLFIQHTWTINCFRQSFI